MANKLQQAIKRAREEEDRPLVAAHRGTSSGIIPYNTTRAAKAAVLSGADIVELDVARSLEGDYFTFHDTYEPRLLDYRGGPQPPRLTKMHTEDIEKLEYWVHEGHGCGHIERFSETMGALPGILVNVDRSYRYWKDGFLDELATWCDPEYALVKCKCDDEQIEAFMRCKADYPFMVVVGNDDELERILALDEPRLCGVEITSKTAYAHRISPEAVQAVKDKGLALWLNSINLENQIPLCAGFDDATALGGNPDGSWGKLYDMGADIIQTDWPWLVRSYFASRTQKEKAGRL